MTVVLLRCAASRVRLHGARHASSYAKAKAHDSDPSMIRNLALVAHIDSGKTTLTESILHASSYLTVAGTVDSGSTTTDFLPAERERGITIQSASIPVKWKNWSINLIDTPGHADFGMEVESASRVVDGAVVLIDSVEGVEAQTKGVWRQLDRYSVPTRMLFLNKLDRPGASMRNSVLSVLNHRLHRRPTILTLPVASFDPEDYRRAEPGIQGLVDLVNWEVWRWSAKGTPTRRPLPRTWDELNSTDLFPKDHPIIEEIGKARVALVETLSEGSDELMEETLSSPPASSYLDIPATSLLPVLRSLVARKAILPVVCGSAFKHVGTSVLLSFVGDILASPVDQNESGGQLTSLNISKGHSKGGKAVAHHHAKEATRLLAWKVGFDEKKGWMTFVRVYSGTLHAHDSIYNPNRGQKERVSKLQLLYANEPEDVPSLGTGAVGVVLGLRHTRTGDTLVSENLSAETSLRDIQPPPAVISTSVIPQSFADLKLVQEALASLQRTDPSVRVESDKEGQLLVHGLGALHLEIVEGRLREEYGVDFQFGQQRVGYREGFPGNERLIEETFSFMSDGRQISVEMKFSLRPLAENEEGDPAWEGNVVLDPEGHPILPSERAPTSGADLIAAARHAIAQGVQISLSNSLHSSLQYTGIRLQVLSWTLPGPTVPASALTHACTAILREDLKRQGLGPILEPYVRVKVDVTDDLVGKVIKDLTEHGGEIQELQDSVASGLGDDEPFITDGLYIPADWLTPCSSSLAGSATSGSVQTRRSVNAIAPLSRMLDYLIRLRALSGGRGEYDMANIGFFPATSGRREEILREIGKL